MARKRTETGGEARRSELIGRAEHDIVALGMVTAATILFVGSGSAVVGRAISAWFGNGPQPDSLLGIMVLLNIALIIFGWRRYRELTDEVGERRKAEATANRLAQIDPLTDCLNRRSTGEATRAILREAQARGHLVVSMMVDLDKFKSINDVHGHAAGDAILVETARRIRALLPEGAILARIGGDEFTCIVPFDPAHRDDIDQLASRLIETISRPCEFSGLQLDTSASVGLAASDALPDGIADAGDALLHMADIAMYQAKKSWRNRYFWYDPGMERELRFRGELEGRIRAGVAHGEFVPYYEKQIDLATGELTGFEMLARWHSPDHGVISPELFIPIAEEIGVIGELSESLIRQALRDAREWDPRLTLSVNISPVQLRDPWFSQKILKLLVEANFPPSRLDIEITETSLHENIGVVRSLVTSLKNQGVQISLDDFGTGYSSLAQLRSLPFDRIKIDRSFVSTLGTSKESETIIKAISSLGEGMNLPITAEGIENPQVLEALRRYGNFKGQGYLYGHPESAATVRAMLAEENLLIAPVPLAEPDGETLPLRKAQ
jgi:diguanylate cyclase (GGDEF)-like protein